jgi:hypothetical protein
MTTEAADAPALIDVTWIGSTTDEGNPPRGIVTS